jgi:tRNA A37 N6-isopentenylltransferase MiaA
MFEAGVEEEVRRALAGPLSTTASKIMGLREIAELPRDEAEAALVTRTRQLAAYQRKWMRRIPGLVSVRADRSPDEVADDVLALARGGQRVPAGRES